MTKTEKIIAVIIGIALIASVLMLVPRMEGDNSLGDSGYPLYIKSMTSTSVSIGPQSGTVLSPSGGRIYVIIGNAGTSTQTVYLSLNGGAATTSSGIILPSGISYTIDSSNQYVGLITAISSSGTSTLTLTYSQ